jgi:hypothetical protein
MQWFGKFRLEIMDYSITFTENCSPKLSAKLIDCLKSAGLLCENVYEGKNTVYVGATFDCLIDKVSKMLQSVVICYISCILIKYMYISRCSVMINELFLRLMFNLFC